MRIYVAIDRLGLRGNLFNYVFKTGFENLCSFDGLGPVLGSAFSAYVFSYVFKTVLKKTCFFLAWERFRERLWSIRIQLRV